VVAPGPDGAPAFIACDFDNNVLRCVRTHDGRPENVAPAAARASLAAAAQGGVLLCLLRAAEQRGTVKLQSPESPAGRLLRGAVDWS